jgi:hypothetical protein
MSKGIKIFAIIGGVLALAIAVIYFGGFLNKPKGPRETQRGYVPGRR